MHTLIQEDAGLFVRQAETLGGDQGIAWLLRCSSCCLF